jgi:hypothetical protein
VRVTLPCLETKCQGSALAPQIALEHRSGSTDVTSPLLKAT